MFKNQTYKSDVQMSSDVTSKSKYSPGFQLNIAYTMHTMWGPEDIWYFFRELCVQSSHEARPVSLHCTALHCTVMVVWIMALMRTKPAAFLMSCNSRTRHRKTQSWLTITSAFYLTGQFHAIKKVVINKWLFGLSRVCQVWLQFYCVYSR
jgi:hypothetical protein